MYTGGYGVFRLGLELALRVSLLAGFLYTDNAGIEPFKRIIQEEEKWLYANPVTG